MAPLFPWNCSRVEAAVRVPRAFHKLVGGDFVRRESEQRETGLGRAAFHLDEFNRLKYISQSGHIPSSDREDWSFKLATALKFRGEEPILEGRVWAV